MPYGREFGFGFIGELSFAVGEGLAPPATQKIFFYLISLKISGGASPSPTNFSSTPLNCNLQHLINHFCLCLGQLLQALVIRQEGRVLGVGVEAVLDDEGGGTAVGRRMAQDTVVWLKI